MRKQILLCVLVALMGFAKAQSVEVYTMPNYQLGDLLTSGDTINVYYDTYGREIAEWFTVKNATEETVSLVMKQTILDSAEGAVISFCFGNCYDPGTTQSAAVNLVSGGTEVLQAEYKLNGPDKPAKVKYEVCMSNEVVFEMVVVYDYNGDGIAEQGANQWSVYPTVTKDIFNVQVDHSSAVVDLFDVSGKCVKTAHIGQQATLDIADLSEGIYLVRIIADKRIYVSKIVKK